VDSYARVTGIGEALQLGPAENGIHLCVDVQLMWPLCAQDLKTLWIPSDDLALTRWSRSYLPNGNPQPGPKFKYKLRTAVLRTKRRCWSPGLRGPNASGLAGDGGSGCASR
jgi:hypothetical protein